MRQETGYRYVFHDLRFSPNAATDLGGIFCLMDDFQKFSDGIMRDNIAPVIETMPADLLTPLGVYLKLAQGHPYSFLLESVEGGENLGRYSFIGVDPDYIVSDNDDHMTACKDNAGERTIPMSLIDYMRDGFRVHQIRDNEDLPPFLGGAIGYIGFDCAEWFEPSLAHGRGKREFDAQFMFFSSLVAFDHVKQIIKIISIIRLAESEDDVFDLHKLYEKARSKNLRIRKLLEDAAIPLPVESSPPVKLSGSPTSNWTQPDFEDAVRRIKELIKAGECYQAVISQCFTKQTSAGPVAIYRAVRSLNPSPYMFLLQMNGKSIIGASPEMLVRARGRKLEYRPIAGTRPRGKSSDEDARLAEEMKHDKKEVAEHLMLVDLGRNDLGRVAEYGSVRVENMMNVEKYSHVQHLVSYLSADLREGLDRFDALASCFPAGTVSGAPKVRAIEIIQDLEPTARGVYAGAVGYFDYAGNMDTCIAIRTLVLEDGVAKVQAGAGIVADSVPEFEYQETVNKAKALLKAIEIAEAQKF